MNFFRNFLLIIFSLVITSVSLKSMDQKSVSSNSVSTTTIKHPEQEKKTKVFIFPYTFVASKFQVLLGSENSNPTLKPFEDLIPYGNVRYFEDLEREVAIILHRQTLGLFAAMDGWITDASDEKNGHYYFLDKMMREDKLCLKYKDYEREFYKKHFYISSDGSIAIFFIKVPYLSSSIFEKHRQKFLTLGKKDSYPEYFTKEAFGWVDIRKFLVNCLSSSLSDSDLLKALNDSDFKDMFLELFGIKL